MSESDTSSVTSFGDISVCQEIGELIEHFDDFYQEINKSLLSLQQLQTIIQNKNNILVTSDRSIVDFMDILEKLHSKVLENIKENTQINFGQLLLQELSNIKFN